MGQTLEVFRAGGLERQEKLKKKERCKGVHSTVGTAKIRARNARNLADVVYPILWGCENFRFVTTQHALQWRARPLIHSRFVRLCLSKHPHSSKGAGFLTYAALSEK